MAIFRLTLPAGYRGVGSIVYSDVPAVGRHSGAWPQQNGSVCPEPRQATLHLSAVAPIPLFHVLVEHISTDAANVGRVIMVSLSGRGA